MRSLARRVLNVSPWSEVAFDICIIVLLFVLVGGFSHRNGGTCERPKTTYTASKNPSP